MKEEVASSILQYLREVQSFPINSLDISKELNLKHEVVIGVLFSFDSKKIISVTQPKDISYYQLTDEGENYLENGSPEKLLFEMIKERPQTIAEIKAAGTPDLASFGVSKALQLKIVTMDKASRMLVASRESYNDIIQEELERVNIQKITPDMCKKCSKTDESVKELKKRKLIYLVNLKVFDVYEAENLKVNLKPLATELTQEILLQDTWRLHQFKKYNFEALGQIPKTGCEHPLTRNGHKSMVGIKFWNFDSLFLPQQHPARDMQDTFFIKNPSSGDERHIASDYIEKVKQVHEVGGYGSTGWKYQWSLETALTNVLRTHTTACSAKLLYALAQKLKQGEPCIPCKYFSIDRVFRNENLDATHLAEFHQVEGLVCGYKLGLKDLIKYLQEFYYAIGITKLKFKPTYNPYTEPSMEVFGYHTDLQEWIEVANSGVFRPEMLEPMGFPNDVVVIAWGLSLERPTMIKYGIRNIRDLYS